MLKTFQYPIQHFPFNRTFAHYFGKKDLSTLKESSLLQEVTDQLNQEPAKSEIMELLYKFTKYIIPMIGGGKYLCGGHFLKVSFHHWNLSDIIQSRRKGVIGVLVPLTSMFGSNSITVEHPPYSRCFRTIRADPGEFIIFDGELSQDPTTLNTTGLTSMALYFELFPADLYPDGLENYELV